MKNYDLTSDEAAVFFEEANELLESLDRDLVAMEQDVDDALVHRVFRAIHTLKGAAGSIGHNPMATLAHTAENLLDKVRNHEASVTTQMANVFFHVVEQLRLFLMDVVEDRPSQANVDGLIRQIEGLLLTEDVVGQPDVPQLPKLDEETLGLIEEGVNSGMNLLVVFAEASRTGIAPLARLLQMYMHLEQIAQIMASTPSYAELEKGEGTETIILVALTDLQRADVESELSNIFEISLLEVADLSNAAHLLGSGKGETTDPSPVEEEMSGSESELAASPVRSERSDQPAEAATQQKSQSSSSQTVRTSVERLDNLMNLAGELVTDRNRLFQIYEDLSHLLNDEQLMAMNDTITHLSTITDRIHDEVFKARMQPIETIFNKFPRFVRQISQELAKEVDLIVTGQDTEVDRTVIEQISDPILHLVRNAIDHGIETIDDRIAAGKDTKGQLVLSARSEEGSIILSVSDDGKGIDAERVKNKAVTLGLITQDQAAAMNYSEAIDLIFAPGLSTAVKIGGLSGRGVGMDVVRNNIQRLNGSVVVYSKPGEGTSFELRLPLTLAIIPTLLVETHEQVFALPLTNVIEIFKLDAASVQYIRGRETVFVRGEVLPLVRLSRLFASGISAVQNTTDEPSALTNAQEDMSTESGYVVSVSYRDVRIGVIVSSLLGKQDVVIKALGYPIKNVRGLTGATLLGDGRIGLIIDIAALISMAMELKVTAEPVLQNA